MVAVSMHRVVGNLYLQLWLYIFCSILFSQLITHQFNIIMLFIDTVWINFVIYFIVGIFVPDDLRSLIIYIIIGVDMATCLSHFL